MSESPLPQNDVLTESDLNALISVVARENRFIEFKREYLPQNDSGKKKFLQCVAAFANSHGGDLVLGMAETDGVATAISPLTALDVDQCRLQMYDLIRVHIRPSLGGVKVEAVTLAAGGHVLVVRVPKSWSGPHILNYGDDRRFYVRDDAGKKRPMEYEEVRDGFLAGETTGAQLRNFRLERCAAILNDDVPGPLLQKQRIVLHLLPFEMFSKPRRFEVKELYPRCQALYPMDCSGYSRAFDLDGCYTYSATPDKDVYGYAYIFRSGAIEVVDAQILSSQEQPENKMISDVQLESKLIEAIPGYLELLRSLEIPPPYACLLSLLNVRGHFIPVQRLSRELRPIKRDHLYLAEAILEPLDNVALKLRPIFDSIWNACGLIGSGNYDQNGNFSPRR